MLKSGLVSSSISLLCWFQSFSLLTGESFRMETLEASFAGGDESIGFSRRCIITAFSMKLLVDYCGRYSLPVPNSSYHVLCTAGCTIFGILYLGCV